MSNYKVKVLSTDFVTHNVKRFVVKRPAGYTFISGQATDLSISTPELENELRPFTFTCLQDSENLEFMIKIYTDHHGVTEKLLNVKAGDELIIHDVFGTIHYEGQGLFLAGGAGITPFISIFRQLRKENKLGENTLLFANRSEEDIILREELSALLGKNFINLLGKPQQPGTKAGRIDQELLKTYLNAKFKNYYICGPDDFTNSLVGYLRNLGIHESQIIIEH
jgi:ferredoxin-NADP reductase